jgi:hypothetical protein
LILAYTYFYQRNLLYHPSENNYSDHKINFNYEEIFIRTNDGYDLKGWFHEKDKIKKKTLVFFHGNAGDLNNRIYKLNELKNFDINILIVAYRGFSGNKGKPTEQGLYEDAKSTLNWLKEHEVKEEQIIIYGESLGTSVSVEVTQHKNFAGIVLESPFTSMIDAGKFYYPYLPVSLLLKDKYETLKKLKNINIPILVMHGKKDNIVPFQMGKKVFENAKEPKFSYFPNDDDHMMNYNEDLLGALNNFFKSI